MATTQRQRFIPVAVVDFFIDDRCPPFIHDAYFLAPFNPQETTIDDILLYIAEKSKADESLVTLWKPKEYLTRKNMKQLGEFLKDNDYKLEAFCDNITENGEDLFSSLLADQSRPRDAKLPLLVARIRKQQEDKTSKQKRDDQETREEMDEDEERDVLTEMIKQFNRSKKEDRDSPSQSAKPTNYLKHQNGSAPILDGRYGEHPTSLAPPIEIYHPAFAAFVGNYHNESLTPPADLVAATSKFMDDMSQITSLEHNRKSTREHLVRLLDIVVDQNANKNKTIADHYVTYDRETQPLVKAALAIIEEKAELGQSSEPSVQGEFSYLHYWTQDDRQGLFDACFCPSFIISVAGPWFSVCGSIHTTHPIVHRLSSFEWLGQSRIIDDDRVHRLARMFYALRLAIRKLKEWYKTLVVPDVRHGPSPARFYPLANKCKLPDDEVLEFCYEKPLKGSEPECVTFLVSDRNDRARRFVVKFVERYGVDAHRLLASHGYAPKLLYYGPVWPDELEQRGVGPRKMVVMEFIEGKTTVKRYPDGYIPQGVVDAVEAALDLLHDGERKMVYGDLREPNIMVEDGAVKGKEKEGTKIVDFDWAGIEGEVRYPFHLSDPVKRGIKGVDDYELIQASHDRARLEKLKGRVKQVV